MIKIRNMTLKDLPQVIRIANMSFPFTGRRPSVVGPYIIGRLHKDPDFQFVAIADGQVVGFITCLRQDSKKAELTYIAVHPAYRRKGVGKSLVSTLEKALREQGYEYIWLVTQPMARPFYEKLGYSVFKISYKLGKELLGKEIKKPEAEIITPTLEDAVEIAQKLDDWPQALTHFIKAYEKEPDKAIIARKHGEYLGIITAKADEYNHDLLVITYANTPTKNPENILELIEIMEYIASLKGYRWIGHTTQNQTILEKLKQKGWVENPLPTFMHTIYMHKKL